MKGGYEAGSAVVEAGKVGGAVDVGTIVVERIEAADVLVRAALVEAEMEEKGEEGTAVADGTVMGLRQGWLLAP